MKLQVAKMGNSFVLILPKQFRGYYNIDEKDWLDLSDVVVIKEGVQK